MNTSIPKLNLASLCLLISCSIGNIQAAEVELVPDIPLSEGYEQQVVSGQNARQITTHVYSKRSHARTSQGTETSAGISDPLIGLNRVIFKVNDVADRGFFKPVATGYQKVVPTLVRTGISNFFNNIGMLWVIGNDLLQFKFSQAFDDTGRLIINSTFGLAGFIDIASKDKVPRNENDLGLTLAHWGWSNSTYLVLPLLGPSTIRDGIGSGIQIYGNVIYHTVDDVSTRNTLWGTEFISKRTDLLNTTDMLDTAALDRYTFTRDAYLQYRNKKINPQARTDIRKEPARQELDPFNPDQ